MSGGHIFCLVNKSYRVYLVALDDEQPELTDVYDFWEEEEIDIDEVHEILGLRGYNATFKTADYEWVAKKEDVKAILTVRDNADNYVDSWMVAAPFIDILRSAPFKWFPTVEALLPSFESEFQNTNQICIWTGTLSRKPTTNTIVAFKRASQKSDS